MKSDLAWQSREGDLFWPPQTEKTDCFRNRFFQFYSPCGEFYAASQSDIADSVILPFGQLWRIVSSLHRLVVDEEYHGRGLGKALCYATMNIFKEQKNLPVYIHTQPWSLKAIFLYLSVGFKLQKTDSFSHYENENYKAMTALKQVVFLLPP